jgi:hypothetical protein
MWFLNSTFAVAIIIIYPEPANSFEKFSFFIEANLFALSKLKHCQ